MMKKMPAIEHESLFMAYLRDRRVLVDKALDRFLPGEENEPQIIFKAMRYSLFAGGKRIRPILCIASAEAVGGSADTVIPVACALECIHTYSLIHDDLPAMDNDDFRRGRPTSHKVFGEDIAILAGDALLTEAFSLLSDVGCSPGMNADRILLVMRDIARAAGIWGMIGGQVMDVRSTGKPADIDVLHDIHARKTGAMIRVSVTAGAFLAGAGDEQLSVLANYGSRIGLAFQIADDILDVKGSSVLMGKNTGSDKSLGKVTFPAMIGLEGSQKKLKELIDQAIADLAAFDGKADPLRLLAEFIMEREF
jgi:geranylgeranyl diphosphate synthase, type II